MIGIRQKQDAFYSFGSVSVLISGFCLFVASINGVKAITPTPSHELGKKAQKSLISYFLLDLFIVFYVWFSHSFLIWRVHRFVKIGNYNKAVRNIEK